VLNVPAASRPLDGRVGFPAFYGRNEQLDAERLKHDGQ
jgi:hypothetical protein